MFLACSILVQYSRPFAHFLPGLRAYERIHGDWPEFTILITVWALVKTIHLFGFRREERRAEMAAIKDDIQSGRRKRMSFTARWLFMLCVLGMVSLGWFGAGPARTRLLALAVPLFMLFAAVELNIVIHPGESLMPDPRDELLMFFKARMLQAGYMSAIGSTARNIGGVALFCPARGS